MKMKGNQSDEDELWATPKALSGAGDGQKLLKSNSNMNSRQTVQRSVKRDEKIKKKLEDDMKERKYGKNRLALKKAFTVAEITPTKSRTVKR